MYSPTLSHTAREASTSTSMDVALTFNCMQDTDYMLCHATGWMPGSHHMFWWRVLQSSITALEKFISWVQGAGKSCLHENATEISIPGSFSQTRGIDSFSETIQTNLVVRAMIDFYKLSKIYFQYYNQHKLFLQFRHCHQKWSSFKLKSDVTDRLFSMLGPEQCISTVFRPGFHPPWNRLS